MPDSDDTSVVVNGKPLLMRNRTRIVFNDLARITSSAWAKCEKPELVQLLRQSDVCVLIYSCTSKHYFDLLVQGWDEVRQDSRTSSSIAWNNVWVIHDNLDVDQSIGQVSLAEGEAWSKKIGGTFRPLSTRTGDGIDGLGLELAKGALGLSNARTESDEVSRPAISEEKQQQGGGFSARMRRLLHRKR